MTNRLRIVLVQMKVHAGDPDANYASIEERLNAAAALIPKPDLIVLPEMWNTGYALDQIEELADLDGKRTKALLTDFSARHGIRVLAGSIAQRRGNEVTNTTHIFNDEGEAIGEYSKIHLFQLMNEHLHLKAGNEPGLFSLCGITAAVMICYDIRFPELARTLALHGAQILFVPAQWPHPRLHHWRTLLQARAIENQMYVVSCNTVGSNGDTHFFGHSMVIDPWGEVLAEADETETLLAFEIDLALTEEVRGRIPVFADRRPSLYEQHLQADAGFPEKS